MQSILGTLRQIQASSPALLVLLIGLWLGCANAHVLGQSFNDPRSAITQPILGGPQVVRALSQEPPPTQLPPVPGQLPAPRFFPPPEEARLLPIDLGTALRLVGTSNLDVAQAREAVNLSRLQLQQAYAQILPTLNMGSTYTHHEGKIQKTEGNIINANRDSLFVGLGPSLTLSFADAIFAPLVVQQGAAAVQAGARRIQNDTLLSVSEAYFAVLRARRKLARVEVTLEYLGTDRPSPLRAGSKGLLPVVDAMQKAGVAEALKAEVYRVQIEVLRRREERMAAVQEFRVAVAELARLLRMDPGVPLWPLEDFRVPVEMRGPWYDQPLEDLVRIALNNRPELAENQALVEAAAERIRNARYRPLLPNLVVNYSWGDFGGGPDPNPAKIGGFGPSGRILHVGTRTDFDVSLLWKLQNFGLGNYLEIRQQETLARQANLRLLQAQDVVITQVVQAQELVNAWRERVGITRSALFDEAGKPTGPVFEAIRQNFQRIREEPKTRPLEVLDSIRSLSDLLDAYSQAITDYERSRFRLLIALGLPPAEILSRVPASPAQALPAAPIRDAK